MALLSEFFYWNYFTKTDLSPFNHQIAKTLEQMSAILALTSVSETAPDGIGR
jgi:hypothetical protein